MTPINFHLRADARRERGELIIYAGGGHPDITPPGGLKPIWDYPNAHLDGLPRFMADRAEAERWRQTFTLCFGEVHGAPAPGWLGLHPGQ
jgi:hypothetical protein